MRGRAISITALLWLALATGARAEDLAYDAAPGCPTQDDFERRLRARVTASSSAAPVRLTVRLAPDRGSLVLREGATSLGERTVTAASCEEAADAIAFVAAILLQERAHREETVQSAPAQAAPKPRSVARARAEDRARTEQPTPAPSVGPAPVTTDSEPSVPTPTVEPEAPAPSAVTVERHVRAGLQAGALLAHGVAPKPRPGLAIEGRLGWAWLELALGVRTMLPHDATSAEGDARFRWTSASAGVCGVAAWRRVRPALCLDAELGRIRARGRDTEEPREVRSPWSALGPRVALRVALWGPLQLAAEFVMPVPLTRDRFVLGAERVHRVPAITIRAAIGLALNFE